MSEKYYRKIEVFNLFLIASVSLFMLLSIGFTTSITIHIFSMWIICLTSVAISKLDLFHPYCWFSISFTLYSTSYAILYSMGLRTNGYTSYNLLLSSIALVVVLLIVGVNPCGGLCRSANEVTDYSEQFCNFICKLLSVLTYVCDAYFAATGFASKSVLKQSNDLFYRFGVYFVRYITMFLTIKLCITLARTTVINWKDLFLTGFPVLLFGLFTGERDVYIRFLVVIFICLFYFEIFSKKHLVVFTPLFIIMMALSVTFKYYFSRGINEASQENSILVQFLSSDFSAAGRNLQYLLDLPWTNSSQGFSLLFTELLSPFVPSGIFFNPDRWFNYVVHTGNFKGYAFTLVGTGYIMGGVLGIIVLFVIVGLIVKFLIYRASKSIYGLAVYFYMITSIIFSFRQSLSSISSSYIRIGVLSVLVCKSYEIYAKKKKVNMEKINAQ